MNGTVITVSQLNRYVKSVIDNDSKLKGLIVCGEISNFKINSFSGHMYFTLKDDGSIIRCVMFRNNSEKLKFTPYDGMKIFCSCYLSVYDKDGSYQLYVTSIQPDGIGNQALQYEQLKEKLSKEGLFDKANKRQLPFLPKKIAVITSDTGAAVHDILTILERRCPLSEILLCPVKVQGVGNDLLLCDTINIVNNTDCDLIIIGRGGGSIEDLWVFNSELLARTIFNSNIPVISAVGHETDFTICDFVSDLRAATPSAAAELAVPDISYLKLNINQLINRASEIINNKIETNFKVVNNMTEKFRTNEIKLFLDFKYEKFKYIQNKLNSILLNKIELNVQKTNGLISNLDKLSPLKVLSRGYAVVSKNSETVTSKSQIDVDDILKINFSDGTVICRVEEKQE